MVVSMCTSVITTRCAVSDGMENPQYIPDESIVTVDDETPDQVGRLRPSSVVPFTVDRNRIKLKFWFMPDVPVESVFLRRFENVKSFSVSYVRPDQRSTEMPVSSVSMKKVHTVNFPAIDIQQHRFKHSLLVQM